MEIVNNQICGNKQNSNQHPTLFATINSIAMKTTTTIYRIYMANGKFLTKKRLPFMLVYTYTIEISSTQLNRNVNDDCYLQFYSIPKMH